MGQRANLVIVNHEGYKLYYCHWCASSLPESIFWGPEIALRFIADQHLVNEWLDNVWAEGGVIVDTERRVLLLWSGEDLLYDIPLRRLYLRLLQTTWIGWQIKWAHDGMFDVATYVGLTQETVTGQKPRRQGVTALNVPADLRWVNSVISIIFEDGTLRFFPGHWRTGTIFETGISLVEMARVGSGLEQLPKDALVDFPTEGLHLEIPNKRAAYWSAKSISPLDHFYPLWNGWEIMWLKDNFEYQLVQSHGKLAFPEPSEDLLLKQLEKILLNETTSSSADALRQLVEQERQNGYQTIVNPYALTDDAPINLNSDLRRAIFQRAVASYQRL
jgi:hypothetical protein